ncbi:hypothetical protein ACFQZ4_12500 [Catellatospora coxensis]
MYGGDFVVHTKAGGAYAGVSNGLIAPITVATTPKVTAAKALETAKANFAGTITAERGSSCSSTPAPVRAAWPGRPRCTAGWPTARPRPSCTSSPTRRPARSSARSTRSRRSPAPATASTRATSASTRRCRARRTR